MINKKLMMALYLFIVIPMGVQVEGANPTKQKRYVIIHADDAGMSHNVNLATIEAMEKGIVSSCSIMVPCGWFKEFATYAKKHPEKDYGIHLTLNSEWGRYKWGPVAPREKVSSLLDKEGFLWSETLETLGNAKASEVEIELKAQIDRALEFGIPLTHLDTHMGTVVYRPDLVEVYYNLGVEYNLPVMLPRMSNNDKLLSMVPGLKPKFNELIGHAETKNRPILSSLVTSIGEGSYQTRKKAYIKAIQNLPPGVSQVIIHCGIAGEELRGITATWKTRDEDRRIFMDKQLIREVKKSGVEVITWKQFHEMVKKKQL